MLVLCHLAEDMCFQSHTPVQILCVVLVTPLASVHCFSHFPRRRNPVLPSMGAAADCSGVLAVMKCSTCAKPWLCGMHMQAQRWLRGPAYFNSHLEGNKTFYSQGAFSAV